MTKEQEEKKGCLLCVHCLAFDAADGMRYVCTLRGKRLREDYETCKLYGEGVKNY